MKDSHERRKESERDWMTLTSNEAPAVRLKTEKERERKGGRDAARRDADAPRIFGVACARPNRAWHSLFFS